MTRLGYLGPEGTYTEEAAIQVVSDLHLDPAEMLPLVPIGTLLSDLNSGSIDVAVAPRRNSIAGDYTETVQGLEQYRFRQIHGVTLQILLALGVHRETDSDRIREVWSKDTALRECSNYLRSRFPRARIVEVGSTAYAMQKIAEEGLLHVAAIGSNRGMAKYGLAVLNSDIGNYRDNYTEFLALERAD